MPPQARVTDNAQCPACSHGKNCCPHPTVGPGVGGSPNVTVDGLPALRIGDPGVHAACCGANSWSVASGSGTVFFNGIPAARLGDSTSHCGGGGALIVGSGTVLTGG